MQFPSFNDLVDRVSAGLTHEDEATGVIRLRARVLMREEAAMTPRTPEMISLVVHAAEAKLKYESMVKRTQREAFETLRSKITAAGDSESL